MTALVSANRNRWVAYALTGLVASMVGASFAAVPLYSIFCKATGYGGTTQRAADNPKGIIARDMTVRFDTNMQPGIPWTVDPPTPTEIARPISPRTRARIVVAISRGVPNRCTEPVTSRNASSMEMRSTSGVKSFRTSMT